MDYFIVNRYFDSSIQNFLMWNESAITSRDLSRFEPVCIKNGIHTISKPIETLFSSEHDPTFIWKLLHYLLIVYSPFIELTEEQIHEIKLFIET